MQVEQRCWQWKGQRMSICDMWRAKGGEDGSLPNAAKQFRPWLLLQP